MRKNKRNLLVAIASMGLVAAGTGAVSTFAWYSVTAATRSSAQLTSSTFNTNNAPTAINGNVVITFAATWTNGEKDSSPEHDSSHVHLTDNAGQEWIYQNGQKVKATSAANTYAYGTAKVQLTDVVSATFGGGAAVAKASLTDDQKAIMAGTYTMRVAAAGTNAARIHLFKGDAPTSNYTTGSAEDIEVSITLSTTLAVSANSAVTFHYTVAGDYDGQTSSSNDGVSGTAPGVAVSFTLNHHSVS